MADITPLETVRYTYRLRPGKQAVAALEADWGRCRFLWNEAVHMQKTGQKPTFAKLCKMLTEARGKTDWLREGSQNAQAQMLRTYDKALRHSFTVKGRGRPTFKARKKTQPSLNYVGCGFQVRDGQLLISKCHPIPVVWSRDLPSEPSSVRVYRDSLGHWYASFVVVRETEVLPDADGGIGIDWGVTTTAATTDERHDLAYLGHRRMCAAQLAKAQRKMARRRRKGGTQSNRYKQAKRETAKLHRKAANQTIHDTRVWAKQVVEHHGLIAVEDFKPKFLAQSTMARKAADAAIGAAKRELIERAQRAGRKVVMVQPAHTTMTCGQCFARNKRLPLDVRTFLCAHCGHSDGRDKNAARVILAVAERGHTSVDDIRQSPPTSRLVTTAV